MFKALRLQKALRLLNAEMKRDAQLAQERVRLTREMAERFKNRKMRQQDLLDWVNQWRIMGESKRAQPLNEV